MHRFWDMFAFEKYHDLETCVRLRNFGTSLYHAEAAHVLSNKYKRAVLPQGNRAMPQVFFSVEVRQQHSLQV